MKKKYTKNERTHNYITIKNHLKHNKTTPFNYNTVGILSYLARPIDTVARLNKYFKKIQLYLQDIRFKLEKSVKTI